MIIDYLLTIENPQNHHAKISIKLERPEGENKLRFFLPSWSPGSYLMREYSRHIRSFRALNSKGEYYYFEQVAKGVYEVDVEREEVSDQSIIEVSYEIYCNEIGVRNSQINTEHAFIHGPSVFMGVEGHENNEARLEIRFPALWSKVTTALNDISDKRDIFKYSAPNYDDFIDCPIEIGCHETDGFMVKGKEHHLAYQGNCLLGIESLKSDIKKIVEYVSSLFGEELPYDHYYFITHFGPNMFGGLEHKSSTALHFDGRILGNRKDYLRWISLVAHEYFHTWNVKRIRPRELGPFDYQNEAYTRMHWLTEGLTSFMDEWLVYRAGLCTEEEYLDMQLGNFKNYYNCPGRKFHSLEDASFNAWIKLYRADENFRNSSISYYLKGGIVFMMLNFELKEIGKSVDDVIIALWKHYLSRPELGVNREEFFSILGEVAGQEISDKFELMISTTEEIDFESYFESAGVEFEWKEEEESYLGVNWKYNGDNVLVSSVVLDSPAHSQGLNANDEILAINGDRLVKADIDKMGKWLKVDNRYTFLISRQGRILNLEIMPGKSPKKLSKLSLKDTQLFNKYFKV